MSCLTRASEFIEILLDFSLFKPMHWEVPAPFWMSFWRIHQCAARHCWASATLNVSPVVTSTLSVWCIHIIAFCGQAVSVEDSDLFSLLNQWYFPDQQFFATWSNKHVCSSCNTTDSRHCKVDKIKVYFFYLSVTFPDFDFIYSISTFILHLWQCSAQRLYSYN